MAARAEQGYRGLFDELHLFTYPVVRRLGMGY
jgi:hypothetical protein